MEIPVKSFITAVLIAGALVVGGCNDTKKDTKVATAQPNDALVPPTAVVPPTYTPAPEPAPAVSTAPVTPTAKTPAKSTAKADTSKAKADTSKASSKSTSTKTYTVKKGETLSEIAKAHKTTVKAILAANPKVKDANSIQAGQTIHLP